MRFRTAYSPQLHVRSVPEGESKTVQSEAQDADINVIVKRFGLTGQLPTNLRPPSYEDYGDVVFDFRSAMDAINNAEKTFMALPAEVRSRFSNDPQVFLEFCTEQKDGVLTNLDEMRKIGLAVPKAAVPEPSSPPSDPAK